MSKTVELSNTEIKILKYYASKQAEGCEDNSGLAFPTIHMVQVRIDARHNWHYKAMFLVRADAEHYVTRRSYALDKKNTRIVTEYIGYGNDGAIRPLCNILVRLGLKLIKEENEDI